MTPNETPFDRRTFDPPDGVASRMAWRRSVIWRANISMYPDPNMPGVAREFAIDCSGAGRPVSLISPRVGVGSPASNVAKSNRWPSTNTLATMSPPPPAIPNGTL